MKQTIMGLTVLSLAAFTTMSCSDDDNNKTSEKTYSIGEFYQVNGVKGVVFKLTDEAGKHGMIVSLDETTAQWATDDNAAVKTGAISSEDGAKNMAAVEAIDGWKTKYPAFAWCEAMNTGGVSGWFMPAFNQLVSLFEGYAANPEAFNASLTENGGAAIIAPVELIAVYWSSSENLVADKEGEAAFFDFSSGSFGFKDKQDGARVRAVRAF